MVQSGLLNHNDTLHVAKLLHNHYRRLPQDAKQRDLPSLLRFTDQFIDDFRTGTVQPHRNASLHLISFLKEALQFERGSALWSWLQRRGNEFVDAGVYGAAIEMLAAQGKAELPQLEAMYAEALQRFPGNFAEYHLSPEAMVPDRGQPIMIKGLPVSLLQGILTARIMRGDWRNSYLAFDTVLRLFPTQVPERFFGLFIHRRPLSEAYTAFMMACRSGTVVRPERLTILLRELVGSQYHAQVKSKLLAVEGMVNAVQAYIGAGGSFGSHHFSMLVKGFEGLLQEPASNGNPASGAINQLVGDTARETVLTISRAGVTTTLSTAASLVGLAGKAQLPEHLGRAIQDISSMGLEPGGVVHRSIVLAAGQLKHAELLEWSWRNLVESAEAFGTQLDMLDWKALARASVNADQVAFVQQQAASLSHAVTDEITKMIEHEIRKETTKETPKDVPARKYSESDIAQANELMPKIKAQVKSIAAMIKSGQLLNFYAHPLPMSLIPRPSLGSEAALRTVYDELTTDPRLPATNEPLWPAVKSATGYPMDELRYANWTTINELLVDAELHEQAQKRRIETAFKDGADPETLEKIIQGNSQPTLSPRRSPGDRGAAPPPTGGAAREDGPERKHDIDDAVQIEAVRKEIRRLRAMQDQPRFALDP